MLFSYNFVRLVVCHRETVAISMFKLLSYVVVVDFWLGEGGEIFGRKWAVLGSVRLPVFYSAN